MSAGGLVALDGAAKAPEQVSGIVLCDSPIDIEWLRGWMMSPGFQALFSAFRSLAA
jgi:pimeloyl-ACP methyl ester carboxylesterase